MFKIFVFRSVFIMYPEFGVTVCSSLFDFDYSLKFIVFLRLISRFFGVSQFV